MDKQQKLDYQTAIENYLGKEHVYDLFEDLLKQVVVKQPDDPISFLIEKLSVPQSAPSATQTNGFSSWALPASRSESLPFRWETTTSSRPFRLATCSRKKSPKSRSWAKKSSPFSSTTQS